MLSVFAGGALFGERHGPAPMRVLLLHGWGRSHRDFDRVVQALDLPSLALDLPGFGASPPPPQRWTSRDFAVAIAPVLAEAVEPVIIVGHSHGGRVAVELAAMAPERVRGLVLIGAPLLRSEAASRPALSYRALRWLNERGIYSDERMERRRQRSGSADYRNSSGVMRETMVTVVNESFEGALSAIYCPVRLLWGANDLDVPVAIAEAAQGVLGSSDVTVVALDGVGHLVPTSAPDAVVAAIKDLCT